MFETRVARTFDIDGSADRVVLFSWSESTEPRRRNLARVDRHGNVVWRAELPGEATHDCFNRLTRDGGGFVAQTFSGWAVRLDANGRVLDSQRTRAFA